MKLTTLATRFLRIGATGFGGPMALIGMMQSHLVERTAEVSPGDFADGVAVGQILPGPHALNCATYLGYRLRGVLGSLTSAGALLLPAFFLMLILTPLYFTYGTLPQVAGFFKGVAPAVVAVILAAAWRVGRKFIVDAGAAAIAVVALAGALMKANPILIIAAAGLLGILIRGRLAGGEKQ